MARETAVLVAVARYFKDPQAQPVLWADIHRIDGLSPSDGPTLRNLESRGLIYFLTVEEEADPVSVSGVSPAGVERAIAAGA